MTAQHLIVLLHGVAAHGTALAWMADHLAPALPADTAFAMPDAPYAFDQAPNGPGRQWFSVTGVTRQNRPERVVAARADFDRVVGDAIAAQGFADRLDKVAFVSFSQGSIMGMDAIATGRWPVARLIAFSGRFATPAPIAPAQTPILIAHGIQDNVIPVSDGVEADAALRAAGANVEFLTEQGVGHAPGPLGMARARAILAEWTGTNLIA